MVAKVASVNQRKRKEQIEFRMSETVFRPFSGNVRTLVDLQNGKRNFQIGKRKWASKRSKRKRQNGMDFIKDSAVKTVNGIKTEFAKTAKRERQNGETERQNGKTETDKTAKRPVKIKTAKCKTVKPKWQNGQNGKRQNGKR